MVGQVTSLTRHGLRDWLLQRVSAVVLTAYIVTLFVFFCQHQPLTFNTMHVFFAQTWVRVLSLLALISVLLHAWIGLWTVLTDYVRCYCLRLLLQILIALGLLSLVAWGILILWGL